ncbi:hypothetical protein [Streptomyces pulveraceus]|uniref:Resolvase/invertase-type recombinase catalytic domain-containing protein n=1 Tax=Streptomyces pulveraceus TaxID=68258 RepID=A0ABW1GHS4_9ACTN
MSPHSEIHCRSVALAHAAHRDLAPEMSPSSNWTGVDSARLRVRPASLERPPSGGQLLRLRQQFHLAAERRVRRAGGRELRLLGYSLVLGRGASPEEDWSTLQAEADQRGYVMGPRLHDVAVPAATTYVPGSRVGRGVYTPPWTRPGWGEVERLIRGGVADGVIVLDRHQISSDDGEYHAVIKELGERYQACVHLVVPEEPAAPT